MKFETIYRHKGRVFITVKAKTCAGSTSMTVCFDNETGQVAYPVSISIPDVLGMSFVLDSDTESSCAFPPSVPGNTVTKMVTFLGMFHNVVASARELIEKEQERIRNENE